MNELVEAVSKATNIGVTRKDVERVLGALLSEGDFWKAMPYMSVPFNVVAETCKFLSEKDFVWFKGSKVIWREKGNQWLNREKIQPLEPSVCSMCNGKTIDLKKYKNLLAHFKHLALKRPGAIIEYDQGYVTDETTVARVALMAQKGDIQNKDILVLGDDDLLSIAAALTGFPRRVVVVEIDSRLVNFINDVARSEDLPVEAIELDLRKPLPQSLLASFDTFWTDPPETPEALELFVGRGIASLKGSGCTGYFGVTFVESSMYKWREFQKIIISKLGAVITDIIWNFNEYMNWDYLLDSIRNDIEPLTVKPSLNWYRSAQYRIETFEDTPVFNEEATGKEIYIDKEALVYTGKLGKGSD